MDLDSRICMNLQIFNYLLFVYKSINIEQGFNTVKFVFVGQTCFTIQCRTDYIVAHCDFLNNFLNIVLVEYVSLDYIFTMRHMSYIHTSCQDLQFNVFMILKRMIQY